MALPAGAQPYAGITYDADVCTDSQAADCGLSVSASRILLTTNCRLRLFDRVPTQKAQTYLHKRPTNAGFFTSSPGYEASSRIFDPRTIYDRFSGRFFVVAAESVEAAPPFTLGRLHLALTTSTAGSAPDNLTSAWSKYSGSTAININAANGNWSGFPDRPSIAVDEDFVYISMVEADDVVREDDRTLVLIVNKGKVLSGGTLLSTDIHTLFVDQGVSWGHELAVDYDYVNDSDNVCYMVTPRDRYAAYLQQNLQDSIAIGAVRSTDGGATWTYYRKLIDLTGPNLDYYGACLRAPGSPAAIGDLNFVPGSLFWSCTSRGTGVNQRVWAVHFVRPDTGEKPQDCGTGLNEVTSLQWYEIDPNGWPANPANDPVLVDALRISSEGHWLHDPSIGVNTHGEAAIFYTKAGNGANEYPELRTWLRDGYGTIFQTSEKQVHQYMSGIPWSDFSTTVPDPADNCQFWSHGLQALNTSQWRSWFTPIYVPTCGKRPGGDFGGDGSLTSLDVQRFAEFYQRHDPAADLDGDGEVTVWDVLALLSGARDEAEVAP